MSFSYERYERGQRRLTGPYGRSTFSYWVPLIITVTAATAGVVAWAWNEHRQGSEEDDDADYEYYDERIEEEDSSTIHGDDRSAGGATAGGSVAGTSAYGTTNRSTSEVDVTNSQNESFVSQMRGAIRRAPSPQKMFEGASKRVSAGMAMLGRGLGSVNEEAPGDDYVDHERWSEEADTRERETAGVGAAMTGAAAAAGAASLYGSRDGAGKSTSRRTVAIVVSAESDDRRDDQDDEDASYHIEHTSLLSHLIGHVSNTNVQLLVLIYAPHLTTHPLSSLRDKSPMRQSSTESFADVADETKDDADPDAAENTIISSYTSEESPALYNALATQAAALVSHPTQIMPFTSSNSHVHMLRHIGPNLVYMQESLCGDNGEMVQQIEGWIGQCVVVVGAEGAGLVDTETEDEGNKDKKRQAKWWMDEKRVGLGKGVEVVEGTRFGEDWAKRVESR